MIWKTIEILCYHIIRSQNNFTNYRHCSLNIRTYFCNQFSEKHKDFNFFSLVNRTLIILKKSQHIRTKALSQIIKIRWLLDIRFINTNNIFLNSPDFFDIRIMQNLWSNTLEILLNCGAIKLIKINHTVLIIDNNLSKRISNRKSESFVYLKEKLKILKNIFVFQSGIVRVVYITKNWEELFL